MAHQGSPRNEEAWRARDPQADEKERPSPILGTSASRPSSVDRLRRVFGDRRYGCVLLAGPCAWRRAMTSSVTSSAGSAAINPAAEASNTMVKPRSARKFSISA